MPHYADGSPAAVGDFVTGKPYNTDHVIAGTIVSITADAESCNCQVAFTEVIDLEVYRKPGGRPRMAVGPDGLAPSEQHSTSGPFTVRVPCLDYGEVRAFTKVQPPPTVG